MHRDTARQARGARLELASEVHTHWKRKAPLYYTYPAPRLIQVLPGLPLADPKSGTNVRQYKEGQAYEP